MATNGKGLMSVDALSGALLGLLHGKHSSLILSVNEESAPGYMSVAQWIAEDNPDDWVSDEERDNAARTGVAWTLQWYPHTPVGCVVLRASSLAAIFERLKIGEA